MRGQSGCWARHGRSMPQRPPILQAEEYLESRGRRRVGKCKVLLYTCHWES